VAAVRGVRVEERGCPAGEIVIVCLHITHYIYYNHAEREERKPCYVV